MSQLGPALTGWLPLRQSGLRSIAATPRLSARPHARTAPALVVTRALFVVIGVLSVSNFNPALMPGGMPNLQQVIVLALWAAVALASAFIRPVLRIGCGLDALAVMAFYGFATGSVLWSDHSAASLLKGVALAATTFGAYRVATRVPIDDIVACCIVAFTAVMLASVLLVVFVPSIGIDTTWMHSGEWQGVFESKQSLGTTAALLMFFTFHRLLTRGGWLSFAITFLLALACVIGSGSRGGGALALAACAGVFFGSRSARLARWSAFGPLLMSLLAVLLIGYLRTTGDAYLPLFGIKVDFTERAIIWQYALHHLGDHPLVGFGVNGFWSIESIYHNFEREHGWVLDNFHDGYIAIITETGMVGLALFVVSGLLFGIKMWWITQQSVLRRSHALLVINLVNLIFFIDFTETYFLRSTNIVSVLLVMFMFVSCAAPARRVAEPGVGGRQRRAPTGGGPLRASATTGS